MATKFLSDSIWATIKTLSEKSRKMKVAVAYFGTGATKLFKLKQGDTLLVAMTLSNVKAGQVNPSEIEVLFKRGVEIFTLTNLHSKIFLFDKSVLVGSTNASYNSADTLIEAGVLTDDKKAIKDADNFFKDNCIERVDAAYIKLCKKKYKAPKFFGARSKRTKRNFKGQLSPLWVLSTAEIGKEYPSDVKLYDKKLPVFESKLKDKKIYEVEKIRFPLKNRVISHIKPGDIIIQIFCHKVKADVYEPCRVLGVIKNLITQKAQLIYEEKKNATIKTWNGLDTILRQKNVKGIKRTSTRRIDNEDTKKLLLNYFN